MTLHNMLHILHNHNTGVAINMIVSQLHAACYVYVRPSVECCGMSHVNLYSLSVIN